MGCACRRCARTIAWTVVALCMPQALHECTRAVEHLLACCIQMLDVWVPRACMY